MRATESKIFKNFAPGTTSEFLLYGGIYQLVVVGTFTSGSATLYELGPDDTTWLCVHDAFLNTGGDTIYLPPGRYRWVTTTNTLSMGVTRVPGE